MDRNSVGKLRQKQYLALFVLFNLHAVNCAPLNKSDELYIIPIPISELEGLRSPRQQATQTERLPSVIPDDAASNIVQILSGIYNEDTRPIIQGSTGFIPEGGLRASVAEILENASPLLQNILFGPAYKVVGVRNATSGSNSTVKVELREAVNTQPDQPKQQVIYVENVRPGPVHGTILPGNGLINSVLGSVSPLLNGIFGSHRQPSVVIRQQEVPASNIKVELREADATNQTEPQIQVVSYVPAAGFVNGILGNLSPLVNNVLFGTYTVNATTTTTTPTPTTTVKVELREAATTPEPKPETTSRRPQTTSPSTTEASLFTKYKIVYKRSTTTPRPKWHDIEKVIFELEQPNQNFYAGLPESPHYYPESSYFPESPNTGEIPASSSNRKPIAANPELKVIERVDEESIVVPDHAPPRAPYNQRDPAPNRVEVKPPRVQSPSDSTDKQYLYLVLHGDEYEEFVKFTNRNPTQSPNTKQNREQPQPEQLQSIPETAAPVTASAPVQEATTSQHIPIPPLPSEVTSTVDPNPDEDDDDDRNPSLITDAVAGVIDAVLGRRRS